MAVPTEVPKRRKRRMVVAIVALVLVSLAADELEARRVIHRRMSDRPGLRKLDRAQTGRRSGCKGHIEKVFWGIFNSPVGEEVIQGQIDDAEEAPLEIGDLRVDQFRH